jgi:hypothetical protein
VFALTFALGVVSGITMSFQFGTNWPGFMQTVGNVAGPLLAYEVLVAFFLEATFLGIMLYGQQRVSNGVHTLATVLVALAVTESRPSQTRVGKETSVPPPATELMAPARNAAPNALAAWRMSNSPFYLGSDSYDARNCCRLLSESCMEVSAASWE